MKPHFKNTEKRRSFRFRSVLMMRTNFRSMFLAILAAMMLLAIVPTTATALSRAELYNSVCSGVNGAGAVQNGDGSVTFKVSTPTDLYWMMNMMEATNLSVLISPVTLNGISVLGGTDALGTFPFGSPLITVMDADFCIIPEDIIVLLNDIVMPDPATLEWPESGLGLPFPAAVKGNYNWFTPAGSGGAADKGDQRGFQATFDGQGHTISNLYIAGALQRTFAPEAFFPGHTTPNGCGFIGHNTGTIKNLKLNIIDIGESTVNNNYRTMQVGGVVGVNGGTIDNCSVSFEGLIQGGLFGSFGGIAGLNSNSFFGLGGATPLATTCGTIKNCTVNMNTTPSTAVVGAALCYHNMSQYDNNHPVASGIASIQNCTINVNNNVVVTYGIAYYGDGVIDGCTVNVQQGGAITVTSNQAHTGYGLIYRNLGTVKNCTVNNFGYVGNGLSTLSDETVSSVYDNCTINVENGAVIDYGIGNGNSQGILKNIKVHIKSGAELKNYAGMKGNLKDGILDNVTVIIDGDATRTTYWSGLAEENLGTIKNSTVTLNGTALYICSGITATNKGIISKSTVHINGVINANSNGSFSGIAIGNNSTAVIDSCTVTIGSTINVGYAGGISCSNSGNISNSEVTISGNITAGGYLGGLVGENYSVISNSTANISGTLKGTAGTSVGGAVGVNGRSDDHDVIVKNCTVDISGTLQTAGSYAGGLVGYARSTTAENTNNNNIILRSSGKIDAPNGFVSLMSGYVTTSASTVYYKKNTVKNEGTNNLTGNSTVIEKPVELAPFYGVDDLSLLAYPYTSNLVATPANQYCFDENVDLTGTSGINAVEMQNLKIYPNPVKDELRIENGELKINNVEIYDVYGKKQFSTFNFQFSTINVSHLSSGIYLIKLETDKGIVTQKFIKE